MKTKQKPKKLNSADNPIFEKYKTFNFWLYDFCT